MATSPANTDQLFAGPERLMALLRSTPWEQTPLGPVAEWPPELVYAVRLIMPSQTPLLIWWGEQLIQIYNDAFAQIFGNKHPDAIAQPASVCWAEAWDDLSPYADQVMKLGAPTGGENKLLLLDRHGYLEETYWTFSYSPIRDAAGNVAGVLVASTDVSAQVVGERRLETVRQLGALSAVTTGSAEEICKAAAEVLSTNRQAVPLASVYLTDFEEGEARLVASYGVGYGTAVTPAERVAIDDTTSIGKVALSGARTLITGLTETAAAGTVSRGPLGDALPDSAILLPIMVPGRPRTAAVVALGVNPYRAIDDVYLTFFQLVSRQFRVALTDASAYDAERQRAATLADLDEDKTRFYQNVSHEFRTPLTLILGPLGTVLDEAGSALPERHRESLRAARRAALRLGKLVNNLLAFSRVEADELHAQFEPTDIAALTADLASMFRSVVENAGLEFIVDVSGVDEHVDVDREMWSEIVLNLLSNAVKFTQHGRIELRLADAGDRVELEVRDTGIGIPRSQLGKVFDRFTQIPGQSGRSSEGTGIGLALVKALATAHAGEVHVDSKRGVGTSFVVLLPKRVSPDVLAARVGQSVSGSSVEAYAAEAEPWVEPGKPEPIPSTPVGRLLLVEDNADMRSYVTRLLSAEGWMVEAVGDVDAALRVSPAPDIVVSDVMLPGRSGLDLLRMLRADEASRRTPVILLTARTGSESATEALKLGADDYVVKPFDPAELLARVHVHHELARLRDYALGQAEQRAANLQRALSSNRQIGMAMGVLMARDGVTEDEAFTQLREVSQQQNRKLRDVADDVVFTGALPETDGGAAVGDASDAPAAGR